MRLLHLLVQINGQIDLSPLPKVGKDGDASAVQTVLTIFWTIAGAVSLLIITIAGFKFTISRGEPQEVAKAKNTIIFAVIGLVVSIMATAIVGFVFRNL